MSLAHSMADSHSPLDPAPARVVPLVKVRLPTPPVAADADLRDYATMPIDIPALMGSRFFAVTSGDEFRAGFTLWCASWHQLPAGSLPDDDRQLARLAGYGRDVAGFQVIKVNALMGWALCSDGNLYHPFVAARVNAAIATKKHASKRTEAARQARLIKQQVNNVTEEVTDAVTINVTTDVTESKGSSSSSSNDMELKPLAPIGALSGLSPDDPPTDPENDKAKSAAAALTAAKLARGQKLAADARDVLTFLNEKAGKNFPPTDSNVGIIVARFKEGFTAIQLRQVIAMKVRKWKGDEKMAEFMRPITLFGRTNFSNYVGELVEPTSTPEDVGEFPHLAGALMPKESL
jgi:uncharacterized phage protein (TIGR02220 family)